MKIRRFPPKAQGEVGLPEGGVGRPLPRHCLEKPPPQLPALRLGPGGAVQVQSVHGADLPLPPRPEQPLPVGLVVEEEGPLRQPPAEVEAQQGQDPGLGGELPHQHPAVVGQADPALPVLGLVHQAADGPGEHQDAAVGGVLGQGLVEGQVDQVEEVPLPQGQVGEKAVGDQPPEGGGGRPRQGPVDPLGQGGVCGDRLEGMEMEV